jgi:hypothetical protein
MITDYLYYTFFSPVRMNYLLSLRKPVTRLILIIFISLKVQPIPAQQKPDESKTSALFEKQYHIGVPIEKFLQDEQMFSGFLKELKTDVEDYLNQDPTDSSVLETCYFILTDIAIAEQRYSEALVYLNRTGELKKGPTAISAYSLLTTSLLGAMIKDEHNFTISFQERFTENIGALQYASSEEVFKNLKKQIKSFDKETFLDPVQHILNSSPEKKYLGFKDALWVPYYSWYLKFIPMIKPVVVEVLHEKIKTNAMLKTFSRADSLRGTLNERRSCYDVQFYHLAIKVDPDKQSIEGSNKIHFSATTDFDQLQVDLFENMQVERIEWDGRLLNFRRELNAIYISFPQKIRKNENHVITIFYNGKPKINRNPPWDGGFVWSKDALGNPWIGVSCQGIGASLWWPTKDHPSDEPDSMAISVTVPEGLINVSNGRLRSDISLPNNWHQFNYFVSYPINTYNATLTIGKFAHFNEQYIGTDTLDMDYYVLTENLEKAKKQFMQVKPMMTCYDKYFGFYPFIRDGYRLVESPVGGMEHQSAIAYGYYQNGIQGWSPSEVGMGFDYLIIHESAHEWWGNSISHTDIADMWIHEGFATYAESIYVEEMYGYEDALAYINAFAALVDNDEPIVSRYGVNNQPTQDMYQKGALMLNTLRHVMDNDKLWWSIIRELGSKFKFTTVDHQDIVQFISEKSKTNYQYFFDQYLLQADIPQLEMVINDSGKNVNISYKWSKVNENFRMPVKVTTSKGHFDFIYPTTEWQTKRIKNMRSSYFEVAKDKFYIDVVTRINKTTEEK